MLLIDRIEGLESKERDKGRRRFQMVDVIKRSGRFVNTMRSADEQVK